jgi:hypothetical protein
MPKQGDVKSLRPPDSIHLQAAEGWIGLGNYADANEELEQIAAANHAHPDVLQLRWRIYAAAKKWDACLDSVLTASNRRRRMDQRLFGCWRSYVLVEMGKHFDAVLKPRIQKVIYSKDWKDGKPVSREGSSHLFKYVRLESYEDSHIDALPRQGGSLVGQLLPGDGHAEASPSS